MLAWTRRRGAHSAPRLAIVSAAHLTQDDPTPQVPCQLAQFLGQRRGLIEVCQEIVNGPSRRHIALLAFRAVSMVYPSLAGAPATSLLSVCVRMAARPHMMTPSLEPCKQGRCAIHYPARGRVSERLSASGSCSRRCRRARQRSRLTTPHPPPVRTSRR